MTPMVFPSSLLLLNAARTPTRKSVDSRMSALRGHLIGQSRLGPRLAHSRCPEPGGPVLELDTLGFWMEIG